MSSKRSARLVAIDSQILVWGIRKEGNEEQKKRTGWLFQELDESKAQVIVPAVALSEYLTKVQPNEQRDVIATLAARFIIAPFDVECAALAAQLFSQGRGIVKGKTRGGRSTLRADALIIATAAVHGAEAFYSGDAICRKMASLVPRLEVLDVPKQPPDLFSYGSQSND